MKSTAKSFVQVRALKDILALRIASSSSINTVRETTNAASEPVLILSVDGNEAAGEPVVGICLKPVDAVSKDIFGNDLHAYTPHTIEVATEEDAPVSQVDLLTIQLELAKIGMKEVVKSIAAGTAVTPASIEAAAKVAELEFDIQWPTKGI